MKTSFFGFTGWSPGVREEHSGRETVLIHSGGRGAQGQPEAFHRANKNFYPGQNGLFLLAFAHAFACVVAVVHDIDPSPERGPTGGPARGKKGIGKAQIGELDGGPLAVWTQVGGRDAGHGFLAQVTHHGPASPIEVDLPDERLLGSLDGGSVSGFVDHVAVWIARYLAGPGVDFGGLVQVLSLENGVPAIGGHRIRLESQDR